MCGLVGVAGDHLLDPDKKAFADLMVFSSVRGRDSAGVAGIKHFGHENRFDWTVIKGIGTPYDLMDSKAFDTVLAPYNLKALIGHTRAATIGRISRANAHPFEFENVVGVHNGTIRGKIHEDEYFGTDSEALYNQIDQHGLDQTISGLTSGAYALVYFDDRDKTLNFLRNSERDLWVASRTDENTIYWASEPGMIYAALLRKGIKFHDPKQLPVDQHIAFKLGAGEDWLATISKAEVKPRRPAANSGAPFQPDPSWETALKIATQAAQTSTVIPLTQTEVVAGATNTKAVDTVTTTSPEAKPSETLTTTAVAQLMEEKKQRMQDEANAKLRSNSVDPKLLSSSKTSQESDTTVVVKNTTTKSSDRVTAANGNERVVPFRSRTPQTGKLLSWFEGEKITPEEYDRRLGIGCAWCNTIVKRRQLHHHISQHEYLCAECWENEDVREFNKEICNSPIRTELLQ